MKVSYIKFTVNKFGKLHNIYFRVPQSQAISVKIRVFNSPISFLFYDILMYFLQLFFQLTHCSLQGLLCDLG